MVCGSDIEIMLVWTYWSLLKQSATLMMHKGVMEIVFYVPKDWIKCGYPLKCHVPTLPSNCPYEGLILRFRNEQQTEQ